MKTDSYVLKLAYNGSDYYGWQIQNNSRMPTIQGELNHALKKINSEGFISSLGASRTDRGVHARAQICKVDLKFSISKSGLVKALNDLLPKNIRVLEALDLAPSFHPLKNIISKTYEYRFSEKDLSIFLNSFVTKIHERVEFDSMRAACSLIVGQHDFQNYYCFGSEPSSTVREVLTCTIKREKVYDFFEDYEIYCFRITGRGFLKQMVRLLVGAVIRVGSGKLALTDFERSLSVKLDHKLAPVMPPEGLCLTEIKIDSLH